MLFYILVGVVAAFAVFVYLAVSGILDEPKTPSGWDHAEGAGAAFTALAFAWIVVAFVLFVASSADRQNTSDHRTVLSSTEYKLADSPNLITEYHSTAFDYVSGTGKVQRFSSSDVDQVSTSFDGKPSTAEVVEARYEQGTAVFPWGHSIDRTDVFIR